MSEINLKAKKREEYKDLTLNEMRLKGIIPGIYYGHNVGNISIAVREVDLKPVVFTEEANIIKLSIDADKDLSCILKDVQFHPITDLPLHFDLMALNEDEKLHIEVSIHLKGNAPGVKEGGVLQHSLHKLNIECMPKDIPSHIDVDVSNLNIGDSIKITDLNLENVNILHDETSVIVSVVPPTVIKETVEEVTEEVTEPEVIGKGKETAEEEAKEKKS
jgi:large subunit ribosomal protein L25